MSYVESTVGQLVVENPARARVFEKHGIDYCCGGKKKLDAACREKGIDTLRIENELTLVDIQAAPEAVDWSRGTLAELADHIEQTHHEYLRQELPRLDTLTEKIARVHGPKSSKLVKLREVFIAFKAELESHMQKEEQILFPICRRLDVERAAFPTHCGSVQNPIRVMVMEHDNAGHALDQFRELTDNYTAPADACNTFIAMFDSFRQLEQDMHQHVHKENNILFPRAVEAESILV